MARMPSCSSNATSASASRLSLGQNRKMLLPGVAREDAVLPWLITKILCASTKGLIIATSELLCGPMMILTPRALRSRIASSARDGSCCVSRTRNRNRTGRYWGPMFLRSRAAICNAATVFPPNENPDPVNDEHANLDERFRSLASFNFCWGNQKGEKQHTDNNTKNDPNFHRRRIISEA